MQRRRSNENEIFNLVMGLIATLLLGTLLMAALTGVAHAEDKKDAKPPESVTLSADVVKGLQDGAKDARIADLEAQNLAREIELAKGRLKDLQDVAKKAQDASNAAFRAALIKAGVPAGDVDLYEGSPSADGSLTLKRKTVAPPQK